MDQKCFAKTAEAHLNECKALIIVTCAPSAEVRLIARVCWARTSKVSQGSGRELI